MWFVFTLATLFLWGGADLFYKISADGKDKYSYLKTSAVVGLVMGAHAAYTLLFGGIGYDIRNLVLYLPVSLMYILSMTIGYLGLRYIEVSVSSPIQNTSGAIVCILCLLFLHESMDALSGTAIIIICISVFLLGILERTRESSLSDDDKAVSRSAKALILPILYCVFDALGTFFDAYYLDDIGTTPLVGVTEETFEDVANTSYELAFFIVAVVLLFYLLVVKKEKLSVKGSAPMLSAAVLETAGQSTYVYAMSGSGAVAAPVIAAYCVVSVLLGRIFLKEKLSKAQYLVIFAVVVGIVLLGIAEA